jgi:hypothetical protein
MRAPFAPHMSCGSRATQAKPEALPSCSESSYDRSSGNAEVSAREDFLTEIFIARVRSRAHRQQRCSADESRGRIRKWQCELKRTGARSGRPENAAGHGSKRG